MIKKIVSEKEIEEEINQNFRVWGSRYGVNFYQLEVLDSLKNQFIACKIKVDEKQETVTLQVKYEKQKTEDSMADFLQRIIEEKCKKFSLRIIKNEEIG